jgi:predicted Zn-dependent protease
MALIEKEEKILAREIGAAILLGADRFQLLAIALLGRLHSLSYSREDESRADLSGADVCASAGYNPWGLVWLFQDFQNTNKGDVPQLLSDHPTNQDRVKALEQHFRQNPAVFGKFSSDRKAARLLSVPKNAPETFLR